MRARYRQLGFSYTEFMAIQYSLSRLDIMALAQHIGSLSGEWWPDVSDTSGPDAPMSRLAAEACIPNGLSSVAWCVHAELRLNAAGHAQPWMRIQVRTSIPQVCQRCLMPVRVALDVERWFRFVADEETAAAEDDVSEEDVLVLEPRMDVWSLMEDELLMALPLVPMHDQCPVHVKTQVMDEGYIEAEAARPNPFLALNQLKRTDSE